MTNIERIRVLSELRKSTKILLTEAQIESLNWAIKICHKYESKRKSVERLI